MGFFTAGLDMSRLRQGKGGVKLRQIEGGGKLSSYGYGNAMTTTKEGVRESGYPIEAATMWYLD